MEEIIQLVGRVAEGFSAVLLETVRGDRPEYPDGTFENPGDCHGSVRTASQ